MVSSRYEDIESIKRLLKSNYKFCEVLLHLQKEIANYCDKYNLGKTHYKTVGDFMKEELKNHGRVTNEMSSL